MIIVPEIETVFILVPRTGSGTLYKEIQRVYPKSMLLYRHMEADGVPQGYDRWDKIGFIRHPVDRLHSLYRFMCNFVGSAQITGAKATGDIQRIKNQVANKTFSDWVLTNNEPWTAPYDINGDGYYWPLLARTNPAPENKLSQFQYLRPDLGTEILRFEKLSLHMERFNLDPSFIRNRTTKEQHNVTDAALHHIKKFCQWDFEFGGYNETI